MNRLLSIGALASLGLVAALAPDSHRVASDQATSAWPSRVLITNDDGTWRGTFAVRGVRDADGDWAALQRGEIVVTPMRVGEMQPLDRYRGMLAAAPRPVGDGR